MKLEEPQGSAGKPAVDDASRRAYIEVCLKRKNSAIAFLEPALDVFIRHGDTVGLVPREPGQFNRRI